MTLDQVAYEAVLMSKDPGTSFLPNRLEIGPPYLVVSMLSCIISHEWRIVVHYALMSITR